MHRIDLPVTAAEALLTPHGDRGFLTWFAVEDLLGRELVPAGALLLKRLGWQLPTLPRTEPCIE